MAQIIIKKGKIKLEADQDELVEICETYDGITFNFKGGAQFYYTNNFMQSAAKQLIKNTADSYKGKKLVFDLDNLNKPVMVYND